MKATLDNFIVPIAAKFMLFFFSRNGLHQRVSHFFLVATIVFYVFQNFFSFFAALGHDVGELFEQGLGHGVLCAAGLVPADSIDS